MPTVTIRCAYPPQVDWPPTEVTFPLSPAHGCQTPDEALQLIKCLRRSQDYFELLPDSDEAPFPFCSETVHEVRAK